MLFVTHMKSPREQPTVIRSAGSVWTYLPDGRWIERIAATNNGSTYCPAGTNRYVWDGQLLLAILDSALSLQTSFAWGLDLSGTVDGAGGVGGLLSATVPTGPNAGTYFYAYDGNGNVMALVNAADGSVAARYEYGPFGELLRATGPMAKANPFRFSTKYQDDETGLLYYGYRYYNPGTGGWPSRDPLGEPGGANLYGFVYNNPTDHLDADGLRIYITCSSCGRPRPAGYDCPWCGGSGPPPLPTTVDAILLFSISACVPLDEAGIAAAAGWKFLGGGVKKVGQCCCKLLSKVLRTKTKVDPNKLKHIFDEPEHKLDDLLKEFGGDQAEAYRALQQATQAARTGCGPGTFEIQITVKGQTITVRGTVMPDGTVKIGTIFK